MFYAAQLNKDLTKLSNITLLYLHWQKKKRKVTALKELEKISIVFLYLGIKYIRKDLIIAESISLISQDCEFRYLGKWLGRIRKCIQNIKI